MRYADQNKYDPQPSTLDEKWYADIVYGAMVLGIIALLMYLNTL